jgi:hypothetical protein
MAVVGNLLFFTLPPQAQERVTHPSYIAFQQSEESFIHESHGQFSAHCRIRAGFARGVTVRVNIDDKVRGIRKTNPSPKVKLLPFFSCHFHPVMSFPASIQSLKDVDFFSSTGDASINPHL